ncbi:MAG: HAD family hydrolase [Candidatus Binatia bacterium]|jgi:phosphoglycolate phosphatase-like HAD superfamily hydrolase
MQLAIFDLDGTLMRTTRVDEVCYVRAVRQELGIQDIDNDWSKYTHSTDSGITAEILQIRFGRPPRPDELARVRERFVGLLAETFRTEPDSCSEIAGASAALQRLRAHPQWRIALATGSWQACAMLKLRTAGPDLDGVPAAFADDSPAREEIIALAQSRALQGYGQDDFGRVVYIGDAPWDVRSARRLGLPFLGIGSGRGARRLLADGASEVLPDFSDFDRLLQALEQAAVPTPA